MMKKIATSYVNEAFKGERQVDFVYAFVHGETYEILKMIDMGTRYGQRVITAARTTEKIKRTFGSEWFHLHVAPRRLRADHQYYMEGLSQYLEAENIIMMFHWYELI